VIVRVIKLIFLLVRGGLLWEADCPFQFSLNLFRQLPMDKIRVNKLEPFTLSKSLDYGAVPAGAAPFF